MDLILHLYRDMITKVLFLSFFTYSLLSSSISYARNCGPEYDGYQSSQVGETWGKVDLTQNADFNRSVIKNGGTSTAVALLRDRVIFMTNYHILNRFGHEWHTHSKINRSIPFENLMHRDECRNSFQYVTAQDPVSQCKEATIGIEINDTTNPLAKAVKAFYQRRRSSFIETYDGYYQRYVKFLSDFPPPVHFMKIDVKNWSTLLEKARERGIREALEGLSEDEQAAFLSAYEELNELEGYAESVGMPLICEEVIWDSVAHDISFVSYRIGTEILKEWLPELIDEIGLDLFIKGLNAHILPKTLDFSYKAQSSTRLITPGFGPHQFDSSIYLAGDSSEECITLTSYDQLLGSSYISDDYKDSFVFRDIFKNRKSVPLGCDIGPGDSGAPLVLNHDTSSIIGIAHSGNFLNPTPIDQLLSTARADLERLKYMKVSYGSLIYGLDHEILLDMEQIEDENTKEALRVLLDQSILSEN